MSEAKYDLTPDRIFSGGRRFNFNIFSTGKIPWEGIHEVPYNRDKFNKKDELFRVGFVKDIKFKKEMAAMEDGTVCERCGGNINRLPWGRNTGCLCAHCFDDLNTEYGTDVWGFKKETENPELTHPWWMYI